MEIVSSVVAGIFVLLSAYLAWRLRMSEKQALFLSEKRNKKEELYKKILRTFDSGIQAIKRYEPMATQKEFIELNAEVALFATDDLETHYEKTAQEFELWANVFPKAWPNTNIIQSPDPAAKHKGPEKDAYHQLLKSLDQLKEFMKTDLKQNT